MESLLPILRKIQKNIDRFAAIVFILLTAAVIMIWQTERSQPPDEIPPTESHPLAEHLPNDEYNELIANLSWEDQLYNRRPIDEDHPYVDIIRYNIFAQREPPTEQEIIEEVIQAMERAQAALNTARGLRDDDPRKRDMLERCIDLCDQVTKVWATVSGAQQGEASDMHREAMALLNTIEALDQEGTAGP